MRKSKWILSMLALLAVLAPGQFLLGQADQGTITGVVQDPTGAVIGKASVVLTSDDTGQVMKSTTDTSGVYVFSPVKIGNYSVSVSAPSFKNTTQKNLHLNIQQRLNVAVMLTPGAVDETVTVTEELPLMQTQESSVGQTMNTEQINSVPLNGRNWVYVAQLSAGTTVSAGSRGAGKGDFEANGQRAEENNFILDGVDNNANVVDFYNGASYAVNPPPDALAEFKVQTSNYSAEFGHSAGAVVNASIKSGSNKIHGSAWEYVRNTAFDIHSWTDSKSGPVPVYHDNQFGATLGGPIFKNKLFIFADAQATRIKSESSSTFNVPSLRERAGDFSELLNATQLGGNPIQLYRQYTDGVTSPAAIANNCLVTNNYCSSTSGLTANATALKILNMYPKPSSDSTLYNNYTTILPSTDNTFQWDIRADWNISTKDSAYSRYSYYNEVGMNTPPLGSILDGGDFGDGKQKNFGGNFMASETHVINQTLVNEARVGFNYLHTGFQHPNANNASLASSLGFGGIPTGELNGGLPQVSFDGTSAPKKFGAPTWAATDEHNNNLSLLDNLTKITGNHSIKGGVFFENIRFATLQPQEPRGTYTYGTAQTSDPKTSNTGYGLASFLLDQQSSWQLSNSVTDRNQRMDLAFYLQDDWRVSPKLTVNMGLRWEYFQPYLEANGYQANFYQTSQPVFNGSMTNPSVKSTAKYVIPRDSEAYAQPIITANGFDTEMSANNTTIYYDKNPRLATASHRNFAPRLGGAYTLNSKTTVRGGVGIFFGGLESLGYWANMGQNYPFQVTASYNDTTGCPNNLYCAADGITIANGFTSILAAGFSNVVSGLNLRGTDPKIKTPYTESWNLAIERSITSSIVGTVSYVGNTSRHLQVNVDNNTRMALANGNNSSKYLLKPQPNYGSAAYVAYGGISNYHSLQTKLEKRFSKGYSLLATYTWSHALDDATTPLGSSGDGNIRSYNLIALGEDYANSPFDTRHRFTFNAQYDLPFGKGRAYLNNNKILDTVVGGWSANAMFTAQTGNYFTIWSSGISTASGFENGPFAYKSRDQFATGGTGSHGQSCATKTKTKDHWFNPCSFTDPWDAGSTTVYDATTKSTVANSHYIPTSTSDKNVPSGDSTPVYVTDHSAVMGYAGGRRNIAVGPGFERVNMSIFKDFRVWREQKMEFRSDIFNLFNTPTLGLPANQNTSSSGGKITSYRTLQNNAPDSRFFQLSLNYKF